jgi:hypothetical protein
MQNVSLRTRRLCALGIIGGGALSAALFLFPSARLKAQQSNPPGAKTATVPLVTGKDITPQGDQTAVGSIPANVVLSPDGRFVLVSSSGTELTSRFSVSGTAKRSPVSDL